jgi:hypothetical protein
MKWLIMFLPLFAAVVLVNLALYFSHAGSAEEPASSAFQPTAKADQKQPPFPDFGFLPPKEQYTDRLFVLRQDYPNKRPDNDPVSDLLRIPFDNNADGLDNWKKYLLALRDYCFEGNIDVGFHVQDNKKRNWYHAPWQHYGRNGREGIHGLTREATAQPKQLASTQVSKFQTYAVGFFNEHGGFTIGQVWKNHLGPEPAAARFPVGTVVFKLLFTQASSDEVPYLVNPIEWKAYAEVSDANQTRKVQGLRLLQMDVMVRDDRALRLNGTGWVFGTYCYNGMLANPNRWYNLVPVGIQWGNDPQLSDGNVNPQPIRTEVNKKLKETIINPSHELPPQHLGWGGRLNGPADYFASSCMSCHSTAQYPVQAPNSPEFRKNTDIIRGSELWMKWFRNLKCGDPFSEGALSTDFSLQLSGGIKNLHDWRISQGGSFAHREEALRDFGIRQDEVKRGKD